LVVPTVFSARPALALALAHSIYSLAGSRNHKSGIGDLAVVQKSLRTAQDGVTNAQIALLAREPAEFEIACQKASDSVSDLSELVAREKADRAAATKLDLGRDILRKSTAMFREIETDAEILGLLASSFGYAHAHEVAAQVLNDALDAEINEPDKCAQKGTARGVVVVVVVVVVRLFSKPLLGSHCRSFFFPIISPWPN
jgi:hypothetical protein